MTNRISNLKLFLSFFSQKLPIKNQDIKIFSTILGHKSPRHDRDNRQEKNGTFWNIDAYNRAIIRKDNASGETLYYQNKDPASNKAMSPSVSRSITATTAD